MEKEDHKEAHQKEKEAFIFFLRWRRMIIRKLAIRKRKFATGMKLAISSHRAGDYVEAHLSRLYANKRYNI
jgi:hypothetical protein